MTFLLFMTLLTACAASPRDLSGRMFTFPMQSNRAHVRLNVTGQDFSAATVCHRSFTDLKRDHILFSLATPSHSNEFLIFWDNAAKEMEAHILDKKSEYGGFDYKLNMWHSICTTWDSESGLVQMWFDGLSSIRKYVSMDHMRGTIIVILGQEQDAHGGGFDAKQSFVGMMTDVHMWDYVLSSCEIHSYMDDQHFTAGNAINWRALEYQIFDRVIEEPKMSTCH